VYNVALPLLRRHYPDQPPFRIIEVPTPPATQPAATPVGVHTGAGVGATVP
jgi:hypothetical protein